MKRLVFGLVLVLGIMVLTGEAAASYWIAGTVNNATDGTPADGHTVLVYQLGNEANGAQGTIGQFKPNAYMVDAEEIPGYVAAAGDVLYVKVVDNGDGYTAGPVSVTLSGNGVDSAPNMTLQLPAPPIVSDPQAIPSQIVVNAGFTELRVKVTRTYFDIDTVMINLTPIGGMWVPMNGSTYRWLMMYAIANVSNTTTFNCTTNASVVGSFSLTVNATDVKGNSNTSISIPLVVTAPKPDLIVTELNLSSGHLYAGQSNEICATVKNNGTAAAGAFNVSFEADGFNGEMSVGGLSVGEETTVCVTDPTMRTANISVTITATADSNAEVDETNETNNARTMAVTVEESPGVTIDYILIKKAGSTGRNWIAVPLDAGIQNASALMKTIGTSCTAVNRWNPVTQDSEGWISYGGGMGDNFNIVTGEGYEIWVTQNTTFNLTGAPMDISQLNFIKKAGSTGRNWIGLPYSTTMTNASALMKAIGNNCTAVNRWNPVTQDSEGWISYGGGMGDNFVTVSTEGYEVWVTANTTWTPV